MISLITKINPAQIVKAHISTLVDASNKRNKIFAGDIVTFFGVPFIVAAYLGYYVTPYDKSILGILITSLSIFAGLLFNLLVLVMQVIDKKKGHSDFIRLQKETYANIAYAILIALLGSTILIVPYFIETPLYLENDGIKTPFLCYRIFWGVIYFLLLNFILTMAMILKRMHAILISIMNFD